MRPSTRLLAAALLTVASCGGTGDPALDPGLDEEASRRQKVEGIYTISYAPNSFVIGNVYPGWTDDVEGPAIFQHGPGNPNGVYYQLGYIYGERFDHCGYIDRDFADGTRRVANHRCSGVAPGYDTALFLSTYTHDGTYEGGAGDGAHAYLNAHAVGCTDTTAYGNVAPWRVPATPSNPAGHVPDGRVLKRRYVSKDGRWVLVHDPTHDGSHTVPNWYFVENACVTPTHPTQAPPTAPSPPPHVCCALCNHRSQAYAADAAIPGGCAQAAHDFCTVNDRGGVNQWYEGLCQKAP